MDIDAAWGPSGTFVGGTGTGVGSGRANTTAIVEPLGADEGTPYAAKPADGDSIEHNGQTFADWFLPSNNELHYL